MHTVEKLDNIEKVYNENENQLWSHQEGTIPTVPHCFLNSHLTTLTPVMQVPVRCTQRTILL